MKLEKLIQYLPKSEYPSVGWLKPFCASIKIVILKPQAIEIVRRYYCNAPVITPFFSEFSLLLNRDPLLIWNADETQLNAKKRFEVLTEKGVLPLVTAQAKFPHLTGMIAVSAAGNTIRPLIILKSLKSLKSLTKFSHQCFFASSDSGWITKDLFAFFALIFISEISRYRMTLPESIRNDTILLIVDGHKSRLSYEASVIFDIFNIDLLILPAHSSHLLQPIDVAVTGPLKGEFRRILDREMAKLMLSGQQGRCKSELLR
jgi:hypothetical protein